MMEDFAFFLNTKGIWLDLVASIVLFVAIVLALLSKKLPSYHEKPLYFVGFFAFVNALTIIATATIGPLSAMSHQKIGNIPETGILMALATVGVQFLWKHYKSGGFVLPKAVSKPVAKKPQRKPVRRK